MYIHYEKRKEESVHVDMYLSVVRSSSSSSSSNQSVVSLARQGSTARLSGLAYIVRSLLAWMDVVPGGFIGYCDVVGVSGFCGERLAKADKLWVESRNGQDSGPSWTGAESRAERRRRRRKREGRGRCEVMTGEDGVVVVVVVIGDRKHQRTNSLHVYRNTDSKESSSSTVEWYG